MKKRVDQLLEWLWPKPENALGQFISVALTLALFGTVAAMLLYYLNFRGLPFSQDPGHWGQAGDFFGGILNPLFGFLSMFALLLTLSLQSRELRLSREALRISQDELKLTREEQAKAAEALQSQNKAIQLQSFEQTFFALLRLLGEVIDGFTAHTLTHGKINVFEGRRALVSLLNHVKGGLDETALIAPSGYFDHVLAGLDVMHKEDKSGHVQRYARTLASILGHLHHSGVEQDSIYPKTLRSLLSNHELLLIYYLCFDEKWADLKALSDQYGLLAHLDYRSTGAGSDYGSFIGRAAFRL